MILQALYEYYQRKKEDPKCNIAPEGWEWKEIPFLVLIDKEGSFIRFNDTRENVGDKKRAHPFLVPSLGEKKGNGIKANLFWENIEYMFGIPVPTRNKPMPDPDRIKEQHEAFQARIEKLSGNSDLLQSMKKFVAKDHSREVIRDPQWNTILSVNQNILIATNQGSPVSNDDEIIQATNNLFRESQSIGICLVTGNKSEIAKLEPAIRGLPGGDQKAERAFVSFNHDAFISFGKEKNFNAPICRSVSFAYSTALNYLLRRDSENKFPLCDSTAVFWSQKCSESYDLEDDFGWFFKDSPKDDAEKGVRAVKNLYEAFHSGKLPLDEGNRFYVLGLAPNAARIAVRFWKTGSIREFADKIILHFNDFEIARGPKEMQYLPLNQILRSTALEYKIDNVPPNLAGAVVESILDGTPYPISLFQQCIRRIRAEQSVTRPRAAILKAYINRFNRIHNHSEKEVTVPLDKTNTNPGYLFGRLFAMLEKAQITAAGGPGKLNTTIRERFYGAFSSSPITVLPMLMKLKNHHLAKLGDRPKLKNWFEGKIAEIIDGLKAHDLPAHLILEDQARFAIGYYHQTHYKEETNN